MTNTNTTRKTITTILGIVALVALVGFVVFSVEVNNTLALYNDAVINNTFAVNRLGYELGQTQGMCDMFVLIFTTSFLGYIGAKLSQHL